MAIDLQGPMPPGYPRPCNEIDENGIPYYRMPPFPDPPEGVHIVPFSEFKESGIQIRDPLADDDEIEIDGQGIPTVALGVKHDLDIVSKAKKKNKKPKTTAPAAPRPPWYEEWEAGEDLRVYPYDQMATMPERLEQVATDFHKGRTWPPRDSRISEWYFRFIYYIGAGEVRTRPRTRRLTDEDESESDVDSLVKGHKAEKENPGDAQTNQASDMKVESFDGNQHKLADDMIIESDEEYYARLERMREAKDKRLFAFLANPELALKIFFSTYFRDGGMLWERAALRDVPRVVLFFLRMLVRCHTLPDCEKQLHAAIKVAELARDELPSTREIGMKIPDKLGDGLTATFGSQLRKIVWELHPVPETDAADEPETKKAKLDDEASVAAALPGDGTEAVLVDTDSSDPVDMSGGISTTNEVSNEATNTDEAITVPVVDPIPVDGPTSTSVDDANHDPNDDPVLLSENAAGWGAATENIGSWGISDGQPGWGENEAGSTWSEAEAWSMPVNSLMALLGPTTLPFTHTVGYVEESTRFVSKITVPPELKKKDKELDVGSFSDPLQQFAQVLLKPYREFATDTNSSIQMPSLVKDPLATKLTSSGESALNAKDHVVPHNPEKDAIIILVDPELVSHLKRGMGLGGTFVQLVPGKSARGAAPSRGSRGRGRGRGGATLAASRELDGAFWYPEKLTQVITSFWTEKRQAYQYEEPLTD